MIGGGGLMSGKKIRKFILDNSKKLIEKLKENKKQ